MGRRALLRGAAAVGVAAAGAALAPSAWAAPTRGSQKIVLIWRDWYASTPASLPLMYEGTAPFRAQHPGVDVKPVLYPQLGGMIPMMLAGAGPDVFQDWVLPGYVSDGLALDLVPYLQRDNVDLSIFPSQEINFFREVSSFGAQSAALYFLPCYIHTQTIVVNQTALDDMGLPYPEPAGMAWADWAKSFAAWTVRSTNPKTQRYGGQPDWLGYNDSSYNFISPYYLYGNGGGYVDPANPTKTLLATDATTAFASEYVSLIRSGVLGGGQGTFPTGQNVSAIAGTGSGLSTVVPYWRGFKWDYYPPPIFPTHQAAYSATDAYGIWSGTKYPELAWEFFKWLTIEPTWARFMMKLQLRGPGQKYLWAEWPAVVSQVVPLLRTKNLSALTHGPLNDLTYPGHVFRYGDADVRAAMGTAFANMQPGGPPSSSGAGQDVVGALTTLAKQIDAIQVTGKAADQAAVANALYVRTVLDKMPVGPGRSYPAPKRIGAGVPPRSNPYIQVSPGGTYTLLGDGWDTWLSSDNGSFACAPFTATEGEWSCRLTAIANLTCPHVSQWSKYGIMARADLSDDSPMVTYHVDGGQSQMIEWQARGIAGQTPWGETGNSLPPPGQTSGAATLVKLNTQKHRNYLVRPVWLKLARQGLQWTPYVSWDGQHWVQSGSPQFVPMGGCWVGVWACSHDSSFNLKGYTRATFDHLSFHPTELLQVGDQAIPPAAGAVPANWATL